MEGKNINFRGIEYVIDDIKIWQSTIVMETIKYFTITSARSSNFVKYFSNDVTANWES